MTMNSTGPISLAGTTAGQSIEIENGGNGTTTISLNDAAVRSLAGVPSGAITMPTNFYGKANRVAKTYTFTTSTVNATLNLSGISGYVAGKTDFTVTVNSGVYLWANSTGSYGFNLTGATTGDTVTLVNNGYIMGQGGNGGTGAGGNPPGAAGGPAFNVGIGAAAITINNVGYIGGGGGGGGSVNSGKGGGGAGGGHGGYCTNHPGAGGGGGAIGASGVNGCSPGWCEPCFYNPCNVNHNCYRGGGGGGRIMPGTGGSGGSNTYGNGGGAGGGGGSGGAGGGTGGSGGSAGSSGGNGSTSFTSYASAGGGGGYGATGGTSTRYYCCGPYGGGAGGRAINKNGKTVTFTAGCTRVYGAIA